MLFEGLLIEAAQEVDGVEIFTSAKFIGNPLAFFTRIIQVQHGRDRIYAQAVDVVLIEPEHRTGKQKAADLGAAIVENVGLPVWMESLA